VTEPAIRASHLTYRIGASTLVDRIDLAVEPGGLVAIIGPNGAGKSTLLALLSGDLDPSAGSVLINGVDVTTATAGDLALWRSMLTQREPTDIPYTVQEVVEMGRHPHREAASDDKAAVSTALEVTEVTELTNRRFLTLSKGEQTRVSLARVLAQETPIVLLDEPTTALDVGHQERLVARLATMALTRTTIMVIHELNLAAAHASRLLLLHHGRLVADGSPEEVLKSGLLSEVYDLPMTVVANPIRDSLLVLTGPG
jgi:iron complex transport system ATP-binding protein